MIDWIRNIVPRIRNYSTDLNRIETLVDKTWIWHEFQDGHSTFHFLRDGRLLITKSGDVDEGFWELIPGGLLHIKGTNFNYMLNQGILFKGVLLIKKQGVADSLEIFYDEAEIPGRDLKAYLNEKINELEMIHKPGFYTVFFDGLQLFIPENPVVGRQIKELTGYSVVTYNFIKLPNSKACDIENGIILRYYLYTHITADNHTILLKIYNNFDWSNPEGTAEYIDSSSIVNGVFSISDNSDIQGVITINNGNIISLANLDTEENSTFIILLLVGAAVLLTVLIGYLLR